MKTMDRICSSAASKGKKEKKGKDLQSNAKLAYVPAHKSSFRRSSSAARQSRQVVFSYEHQSGGVMFHNEEGMRLTDAH